MFLQVIRFVRLPLLLLVIYALARFAIGLAGVPYAPRGNAMFSVLGVAILTSLIFGALSGKVGGFGWLGAVLVGFVIGLFAQILIFSLTFVSYAGNLDTYYRHWDALNLPEGTTIPLSRALMLRAGGLLFGPITTIIMAVIGRALATFAPTPARSRDLP